MKFEVSVELTELEDYLCVALNNKMNQVNVEIVFSEENMTDYIKVIDENGEICLEKAMDEAFDMIKEALIDNSIDMEISSYCPTEEGFAFELV